MRKKPTKITDNVSILGTFARSAPMPNIVHDVLHFYTIRFDTFKIFHRLFKNNIVFNATSYTRKIRTISSCIQFSLNGVKSFGQILNFVQLIRNETYAEFAIVQLFDCTNSFKTPHRETMQFIQECNWSNKYVLLKVTDNFSICHLVTVGNLKYIVEPTKIISVE